MIDSFINADNANHVITSLFFIFLLYNFVVVIKAQSAALIEVTISIHFLKSYFHLLNSL